MAEPEPHDLSVGDTEASGPLNPLVPGPRVGRRGGLTWQQDTAGNWIRLLGAAGALTPISSPLTRISHELWLWAKARVLALQPPPHGMGVNTYAAVRSEATFRGLEGRSANSPPVTNIIRVSRNHQQLHKELLFTHRKGLTLRSKPELLQVLELRNRRREGIESSVEQSPLERELQRWQQRREQRQQQEESGDTSDHPPEFIRVRENLRRIQHLPDVPAPPQHAKPFLSPGSLRRPHLTNAELSKPQASPSPEVLDGDSLQLQGSTEASSVSSAPSQCSLANS